MVHTAAPTSSSIDRKPCLVCSYQSGPWPISYPGHVFIDQQGGREHVQPQLCQSARSINTPRLRRAAFSQSSLFCAVWNGFDDEVISRQSSSEVDMDAPRRLASRPWANLLESIFFRRYKCFVSIVVWRFLCQDVISCYPCHDPLFFHLICFISPSCPSLRVPCPFISPAPHHLV